MGKDLKGKDLGKGYRQRSTGMYDARFTVNGQEIYLTDSNLAKLKKRAADEIKKYKTSYGQFSKNTTVTEWFMYWLDTYKAPTVRLSTYEILLGRWNYILKDRIGFMPLSKLNSWHIQQAINDYMDSNPTVETPSIAPIRYTLSNCLDVAISLGLIQTNPCIATTVPKRHREQELTKKVEILSKEDALFILDSAKSEWFYYYLYVLMHTGMRAGEMNGLMWKDIDFENKCINVRQQMKYSPVKHELYLDILKTKNAYRVIPFIGDIENILIDLKSKAYKVSSETKAKYGDLVFATKHGYPIRTGAMDRTLQVHIERLSQSTGKTYPHTTLHKLRHLFCTECFCAGMNPKVVQMLMGHASYSMTANVYTHITDDLIRQEVKKL